MVMMILMMDDTYIYTVLLPSQKHKKKKKEKSNKRESDRDRESTDSGDEELIV